MYSVLAIKICVIFVVAYVTLVVMTARDGRVSRLENVFLRGGHIKFIVLPEMLKNSPILKKVQVAKSKKEESSASKNSRKGSKPEGQPAQKKQRHA